MSQGRQLMTKNPNSQSQQPMNRRSLLKTGVFAGGAVAMAGAGLLTTNAPTAYAQESKSNEPLTRGAIAVLRFLAAAELIESDLWNQYAELGGVTDGTQNNYQLALQYLDGDGSQYITSNTLDENTHADFLNKYLEMKGAEPVDLTPFKRLPGSTATGSSGTQRLTNLMNLNVDTSWYTRYRSSTNPDFGATFPQAITIQNRTAIPRNDNDFDGEDHIQAIANTAAFHFGSIEQGGSSLYPAMGVKVTNPEVLQIIFGIGGDEVAHFLEWVDFAGNAVQGPPFDFNGQQTPVTDNGLTFPNFNDPPNPQLQTNLIFPVPCEFINPTLPKVSVLRPLTDKFAGAQATVAFLEGENLFQGQGKDFLQFLMNLAAEADAVQRNR
jgi:hypothetical protein